MLVCPWEHTCASFVNFQKKMLFFCVHLKGANSYGQLGLGHKEDVLVPQALKDVSCECQDIASIAGGGGHSAVITGKNTALALGCLAFNHFLFGVSLLVQCCHLSVAAVSEQVQSLVANQLPPLPVNSIFGEIGEIAVSHILCGYFVAV